MTIQKAILTRLYNSNGVEFFRVTEYDKQNEILDTTYYETYANALDYLHRLQNEYKLFTVNISYIDYKPKKWNTTIKLEKHIVVAKLKKETWNKIYGGY